MKNEHKLTSAQQLLLQQAKQPGGVAVNGRHKRAVGRLTELGLATVDTEAQKGGSKVVSVLKATRDAR